MSGVAWKVAVAGVAGMWLSAGLASAQGSRPGDVLPPPPATSGTGIYYGSGYDYSADPVTQIRRPASSVNYADSDSSGSTAITDWGTSGRQSGGWSDRSAIKGYNVAQSNTNSTVTTNAWGQPQPGQLQSVSPVAPNYVAPPPMGYAGSQVPGAVSTPGVQNCGPPGGPQIPYVPYSAAQAPLAPTFYPCPYYPPCYCYSGQLCATAPCLCPPPCGQPGWGQIFGGQTVNGQPQNNQTPNSQTPNGQTPNGQTPNAQPSSAQPAGSQSNKTYPVHRTAYMELDYSGSATQHNNSADQSNGSSNNAPPPPVTDGADNNSASSSNASQPATDSSSQSNSSSSASSCSAASSCSCSTCGGKRCGGNSCGCDSCGCDTCWCHKFLPLFQCDDPCPLKCDDQPTDHLFADCCCLKQKDITITGWSDTGIMANGRDTADGFNGPLTFADRNGEGQANQLWISFDRSAPANNCGWFIGGHVDYFFGSDYFFTTAAGLDGTPQGNIPRWHTDPNLLYGFAMPQLYVETDYDDWKIKWGHFFTIIGYEVVPAIGNFFYSHSYTMQYGEPFTHTGFLVSKNAGDNWSWSGGLVAGWNTFDTDDRAAWLGGVTYTDKDWGSLAFSIITGQESELNITGVGPFANRTMYSLVWSRSFTSRFSYVLQHDYGIQDNAITFDGGGAEWYGINQYLFYKLNCCWTAGLRVEWFRDNNGFVVTTARPGNADDNTSFPGNFYEVTLGLNYKPNGNLAIRPEVRWDAYQGQENQNFFTNPPVSSPFNDGTSNHQFTFGVDLVAQW